MAKKRCPLCEAKVFNLKRHLLSVHSTTEKYAEAERNHAAGMAKGPGTLRCVVCNGRYLDLSTHMSREHSNILSKKARLTAVRASKDWDSPADEGASVMEVPSNSVADEPSSQAVKTRSTDDEMAELPRVLIVETGSDEPTGDIRPESTGVDTDLPGKEDTDDEVPSSPADSSDTEGSSTDHEATDISELINKYSLWLQTFEGGDMERDLATELAGKIRRMDKYGLNSVQRYRNGALVSEMFQDLPTRKNWAPGTTVSYICAYKDFLVYLTIIGRVTADQKEAANAVVTRISKAVYRQRRLKDAERAVDDEKALLRGSELRGYQAAGETVRIEGLLAKGRLDSPRDYCHLRNHLMLRVCVANRQRAGAIANMTVEGLNSAKAVSPEDSGDVTVWTVVVAFHKTAATHGPATLGLEDELFQLLLRYVECIRTAQGPNHINNVTGPLWLTREGNKVSSKRVSRCIQKAWRRAGQTNKITATILRKTAVSKGFDHDPTVMPLLGSHMSHSQAVQEKYYMVTKKRKNTANMTQAIKRAAMSSPAADTAAGTNSANTERRVCLPTGRPSPPKARRERGDVFQFIAGQMKTRSTAK